MSQLDDAIQQAREALHIVPFEHRVVALSSAVAALVKAVEECEPHLIDTRRLAALASEDHPAALECDPPLDDVPWRVWVNGEAHPRCSTPAEALGAAEREAGQ